MNGTKDIFQNEKYTPVWNRVFFSDEWPVGPNESLILTLKMDQNIVSAKQMGPDSIDLFNALLAVSDDPTQLVNLNSQQQFTFTESDSYFMDSEHPLSFGVLTYTELTKEHDHHTILEWMNQRQIYYTLQSLTAEQLLEGANYQVQYQSLIDSLSTYILKTGYATQLVQFNCNDIGVKHVSGWEQQAQYDVIEAEQMITKIMLESTHNDYILYSGDLLKNSFAHHLIVPIFHQKACVACFMISVEASLLHVLDSFTNKCTWLSKLLQKGYEMDLEMNESRKKDLLLEVTKKFHSTMDISEVLAKIVYAIKKTYPSFDVFLMLTHEWEVREELPIKPLLYGYEGMNAKAEQAFLTGNKQIDRDETNNDIYLFVPLRGKQGIYGVLEVRARELGFLPKEEVSFIELLADTGGNALENAELYKQSRDLIQDLKLINRTTHQLNKNLNLNDLVESMTTQILEAFGAEEVGFLLFDRNDQSVIHQSGTGYFQLSENIDQFDALIQQLLVKKDPIYIGDTNVHPEVQVDYYQSMLVVPMVHNNSVHGAVFVLHRESYHFTFESFKLLQSLVHHSTLAFSNSLLHEELEKLVITDHLTSLHSRNHLEACMDQSILEHEHGTFLLMDIDNFKQINDTYGHQIGDEIIVQVANIIRNNIRDTDIAARWGGEELAVYLPKVELKTGTEIAKRIVKAVALETNPKVTISCGVSFWNKDQLKAMTSSDSLFKHADAGLYKAKEEGKNQVVLLD